MRAWLKLICCFLAIGIFVKVLPLVLNSIKSYHLVVKNSEELGIDNSALFYSEEPLTSIAENELLESLKPKKH
jgi:hypothetical protein